MNTLKLEATNPAEQRVLDYLTANASDALAAKINAGTKTLNGAMNYCKGLAQEKAANGVACIDEATVYGWCIHFFEEADVAEEPDRDEPDGNRTDDDEADDDEADNPAMKPVNRKKQESAQAELDLFGGEADDE